MDCPVCPHTGIPDDESKCPNCNVDLTPLRRVQQLASATTAPSPRRRGMFAIVAVTAIVATLATAAAERLLRRAPAAASTDAAHASMLRPAEPSTATQPVNADSLNALAEQLDTLEGVTATRAGNGLTVRFDDGLFRAGSNELTPTALSTLPRVASAIANRKIEVRVDGFTDPAPPSSASAWRDNWTLALGRAQAAAGAMHRDGDGVLWLAAAGAESEAPYSNDTPDGRRRNRTVVLHIRPL